MTLLPFISSSYLLKLDQDKPVYRSFELNINVVFKKTTILIPDMVLFNNCSCEQLFANGSSYLDTAKIRSLLI